MPRKPKKKSKAVIEVIRVKKPKEPDPPPPPKRPKPERKVEIVKDLPPAFTPKKELWPGWLQLEHQKKKLEPVKFSDNPLRMVWPPEDGAVILAALSFLGTRLTDKKKVEGMDSFSLAAKLESLGMPPGRRELSPEMVETVARKVLHIWTKGTKTPETVSRSVYGLIFWPDFNGGFM